MTSSKLIAYVLITTGLFLLMLGNSAPSSASQVAAIQAKSSPSPAAPPIQTPPSRSSAVTYHDMDASWSGAQPREGMGRRSAVVPASEVKYASATASSDLATKKAQQLINQVSLPPAEHVKSASSAMGSAGAMLLLIGAGLIAFGSPVVLEE